MSSEVTSPIPTASEETPPVRRTRRAYAVGAWQLARSFVTSVYLPWAIVGLGVLIRVVRYAAEQSLWLDEAYLVLNLKTRSYGELLQTLDFNQAAPPGFLFVEKLVLGVLGDSEYALRLFPFLAGIASMVLAYPVARRYLSRWAVPLALFLFAVLEPFTFFATEVKQYSTDILVTLVLLYLFTRVLDAEPEKSPHWVASLTAVAAAGVWLSYPSVFVVAAVGVGLWLHAVRRRNRPSIIAASGFSALLALSFALVYFLSINRSQGVQESAGTISRSSRGVVKNLYLIFSDPAGLTRTVVGLAAVLTFVGAVSIARRRPEQTLLLGATVGFVLIAGLIGEYPIGQRFLAFLLPLVALGLAEGIVALAALRSPLTTAVTFAVAALVLAHPGLRAAERTVNPPRTEEIRPLLQYIDTHWRPGDTLYVSTRAQYAFRYYLECNDCSRDHSSAARRRWQFRPVSGRPQNAPALVPQSRALIVATSSHSVLAAFRTDIGRLRGRNRVWVLFSHYYPYKLPMFTILLNEVGKQLDVRYEGVAAAYLYDFRP